MSGPDPSGPDPSGPDQPGPDRPGPDRPGPDRPGPDRPGPDRPGPDRPGPDRPGPNQPGPDRPGPNRPGPDRPGPDRPGPDRPGPDRPGPDRPGPDRPGPNRPGPDRPGPDRPGPDRPGPDRPGPDRPGPNQPGPDRPGPDPSSSQNHADPLCCSEHGAGPGDESLDPEPQLDQNQQPVLCSWTGQGDTSWRQDGDRLRYGLDRKWLLWHEFMQEHAHLDAWLRLAEQAINTWSPAHLSYSASQEELRRFQRLRGEAGSQLIRLDGLTRRNRILPRLFQGAVRVRLLMAARECGRRWDAVDAQLETITGRLQLCVSEWEEFEAERAELALWLADMDARLTDLDHMTGSDGEKLRELQSFQQVLSENSGRVNDLLRRGEELLRRRAPADARRVESHLLELLRRCSHVYDCIARTHTRLLGAMLVFEGDPVLTRPAESVLQSDPDPSSVLTDPRGEPSENHQNHPSDFRQSVNPTPTRFARRPPTPPPSPSHEPLGLEWDPSVDIGGSLSHDDADSSYFSACTGLSPPDETKRWSYLSSSGSDITADITNQEAALDQSEPGLFSADQWAASSPEADVNKPMRFDGGRVKAWLRVQSSAPAEVMTSCSRAVQTDGDGKDRLHGDVPTQQHLWRRHGDRQHPLPVPEEQLLSEPRPSSSLLLLLLALALLAGLILVAMDPPCHRSNRMPRSLHLTLSYVNGPPPT